MATATKSTNRWTPEQLDILNTSVNGSSNRSVAFKDVGEKLGKSAGTVAAKWYAMQRDTKKKTPKLPAAKSVAKLPSTNKVAVSTAAVGIVEDMAAFALLLQTHEPSTNNEFFARKTLALMKLLK